MHSVFVCFQMEAELENQHYVPKLRKYESLCYHEFVVNRPGSGISIEVEVSNPPSSLVLFFRQELKPTTDEFDERFALNSGQRKRASF